MTVQLTASERATADADDRLIGRMCVVIAAMLGICALASVILG